jgi:hypothetical protein
LRKGALLFHGEMFESVQQCFGISAHEHIIPARRQAKKKSFRVRPPWPPVARSIRRFSSVPPCPRGEGWFGGLGRSPPSLCSELALSVAKGQALQGSGLVGVPLTQAVGP